MKTKKEPQKQRPLRTTDTLWHNLQKLAKKNGTNVSKEIRIACEQRIKYEL